MKLIASELNTILREYSVRLNTLTEPVCSYKASPFTWSKKELIGHLVDSAQNNIRRFILSQYQEQPHVVYDQDRWVSLNNYQEWEVRNLAGLWELLNRQICLLLQNPSLNAQKTSDTGELHTVEWLARDYIKHLRHHLHQICDLEPVSYP